MTLLEVKALIEGLYRLKLLQQVRIQTKTDLRALAQVLAWFDQFKHSIIPSKVWLQCQLALAEGFTNAVRHAHKGRSPDTAIDIEVKVFSHHVEIRILDYGCGFDLDKTLDAMVLTVNRDAEGGRGLKLMKQMADVLSYTRINDQQNCLLIVKNYPVKEVGTIE